MTKSKFILFLITFGICSLLATIVSCNENRGPKAPESKRLELDSTSRYYDQSYKVYTLEGCEYIVVGYSQLRWGSHKGNCKNPIHTKIQRYTEWK
jgi:hypothetical protein